MVDTTVRQNQRCVIDLPGCGYVFSSSRSCFIAYGFRESALEKDVLRSVLEKKGIEAVEAGAGVAPGKYAFCHKICSKIIQAQFCIVLLNNDLEKINGQDIERPNANVNLEYGLMLGHNKYVIPFQREGQALPFNVSGLDTVIYNNANFSKLAEAAIHQAIRDTTDTSKSVPPVDQAIISFCLAKGQVLSPTESQGDRDIYALGSPLGFNLFMSFDGLSYTYLGNFTTLHADAILWRLERLLEHVEARLRAIPTKIQMGLQITPFQQTLLQHVRKTLKVWVVVTSDEQRQLILSWLDKNTPSFPTQIFTLEEVRAEVSKIGAV